MKRILLITFLALAMTACGGGGSETSDAAKPPAPQNSGNGNNGNGGNGGNSGGGGGNGAEQPLPEPALSLGCSPTPSSGFVAPGAKATATFKFNQTYNGAGSLLFGKVGEMANQENVFINGNQLVVTRNAANSGKYSIRLNVNGTGLTAVCTWNVGFELVLADFD